MKVKKGDVILVDTEYTAMTGILKDYQKNNLFRIYFPAFNETANGSSVTCFDVAQYNSSGDVVQQFEFE